MFKADDVFKTKDCCSFSVLKQKPYYFSFMEQKTGGKKPQMKFDLLESNKGKSALENMPLWTGKY